MARRAATAIRITRQDLLDNFLALYEEANDQQYLTQRRGGKTVPVVVGAGISSSADVPLNTELLNKLFSGLSGTHDERTYQALYDHLKAVYAHGLEIDEDLYRSVIQDNFRNLLAKAGIPRRSDHPFPNLSNLLLVHCVHSGVLGPVVSLNVDPLLQTAACFLEDGGPQLRYIQNISEFSDIVHDFESRLIIQPHGTIEEPLSLRFLKESLLDKDSVLVKGIAEQLDQAPGLLCIGFSWDNGVIEKIVRATIEKRCRAGHTYKIIVTCFGAISPSDLKVLNAIASKFRGTATIYYAEDVNSDDLLENIAVEVYRRTLHCREQGISTYYARDPSRIRALNRLVSWLFESEELEFSDRTRWSYHSSLMHLLSIECILYFVAASDPSSLYDLVKFVYHRSYLRELGYNDSTEYAVVIREVLKCLKQQGIIEEYTQPSKRNIDPSCLDDIDGALHVLSSCGSMEEFSRKVLTFLTSLADTEHPGPPEDRVQTLSAIFDSLEVSKKDRPQSILRAIALLSCFEKGQIIPSLQALDELLDRLKAKFKAAAEAGEDVSCYVCTETGDHLFTTEFHDLKRTDWSDPQELKYYMLEWLHSIFDTSGSKASVKLLLPITDPSWRVDDSAKKTRSAAVLAAFRCLSKLDTVTICYLPWDKHDDHMWLLKRRGGTAAKSEGALFPRRHQESNHCAIHINSTYDVESMIRIFESQAKQFGTTVDAVASLGVRSTPSWHVLAVTMVDGRTLDANNRVTGTSRLCVVVRRPETNRQHKNVASVPTKKIPEKLFWDIVGTGSLPVADVDFMQREFVNSDEERGSDPLVFAIDDLLASKMGLADEIEERKISYRAKASLLKSGYSPQLSDDDQDEYIRMLNALVIVDQGFDLIPDSTRAYAPIADVSVDSFLTAVTNGVAVINDNVQEYKYICAGLCICTTGLLLNEIDQGHEDAGITEGPLQPPPSIVASRHS